MNTWAWTQRPSPWLVTALLAWLLVASVFVSRRSAVQSAVQDASNAPPVLGVLVDSHMRVIDVDWWGPAKRAGIQRGDILTALGGRHLPVSVRIVAPDVTLPASAPVAISTTADVRALFRAFAPQWGNTIAIGLDRQGRSMTVTVPVTAKAHNYDPSNPPPTVTPVPASMDSSAFYL